MPNRTAALSAWHRALEYELAVSPEDLGWEMLIRRSCDRSSIEDLTT